MRIWFDTGFYENGRTIDLISIGMVREDGATFYAETDFADAKASQSDWLAKNVRPHLRGRDAELARGQLRRAIVEFAGEKPEFWAYYASYDWVALCQLFGTMLDLPKGWPFRVYDFRQWLDHNGKQDIRQPEDHSHDALADAQWIAQAFREHGPK